MNNKGFTLVELLITITVLSVILLIAGVSVFTLKNKFDQNYYKTLTNNLKVAAKDYSIDHRSSIPKEGIKVDITTFVKNGYISDVISEKNENCTGYVLLKKDGYKVTSKVCLKCDNYISEGCN